MALYWVNFGVVAWNRHPQLKENIASRLTFSLKKLKLGAGLELLPSASEQSFALLFEEIGSHAILFEPVFKIATELSSHLVIACM